MSGGLDIGWLIAGVAFAWSVINTVYTWYSASRAVTKKEIDTLMRDANLIGNRLTALESEIKLMPSADQYHDLKVMVVEVRGGMATLSESIKPIARSVQRIDEFLMNAAQDGRSSRR